MTPIKRIVWVDVFVYTQDHADQLHLCATAPNPDEAKWLAWSLARAHGVEHSEVILSVQIIDAEQKRRDDMEAGQSEMAAQAAQEENPEGLF